MVFVYKNYCRPAFTQISQNAFLLVFSSLWFITNPVQSWTVTQGPPFQSHFFKIKKWVVLKTIKQSNKQTTKQPNNQAKTDEHQWAPMNAHEAPGAPMNSNVFCDFSWNPFFHTNAACKLYGQPLFSQLLIYHLGRLVLHVFNSWKFCFKQILKIMFVSLHSVLVWRPEKKLSIASVAAHVYM